MQVFKIMLVLYLFYANLSKAQELELYTRTTQNLYSTAINDSFLLDVAYPKYHEHTSPQVSYPLIVLFDSYNRYTFSHHLKTIDMLTGNDQMPEAVVVGIPFTPQNRKALTSVPGIDNLQSFVFDQVIPTFQKAYHATGPVLVFGHSRTGYAVGYFTMKNAAAFQAAGVFSGFFDTGFTAETASRFIDGHKASGAPFALYYSAGANTLEEATYMNDLQQLPAVFAVERLPENLRTTFFRFGYANHMTNYNLSVEAALLDYFGPYNLTLDNWLFNKTAKSDTASSLDIVREFYADFIAVSSQLGAPVSPTLTHFISLASYFMNRNPEAAFLLLSDGKKFYPGDFELDYYLAENYIVLENMKGAKETITHALKRLDNDMLLTTEEKMDWQDSFNDLLKSLEEY
jgi:enterochelin esterase-like enzyme